MALPPALIRPSDVEADRLKLQLRLVLLEVQESSRQNFIDFARYVWPAGIISGHHQKMAAAFDRIINGTLKRLIISMPPRHSKSEYASYLLPAYAIGRTPNLKIIQATHTGELAVRFGRKVRNLMDSGTYGEVFADVQLKADSKAAGRWDTDQGGEYFAVGVGGAMTGRGADLLIIDDPHALPLDTQVPTPMGFRLLGDLVVGDEVYGPDGKPTTVVAKSDVWRDRELYRLTTSDGEEVLCDGGHLWPYMSDTSLKKGVVTQSIARELCAWDNANLPIMPRHAAVEYPQAQLPVDPYVLGAWLGDGTTGLNRMTAHPDDSTFMRGQFEAAGFVTTTLTDPYSFGIKGLRKVLRGIGVLFDKHVPQIYLTASVEQRMALLQGLMDTDGNVTQAGECSFNNTNEGLTRAVRELVHSLGVKAKMCVYYDSRPNHSPIYRINFKLANCFKMPRKRERAYTPTDKRRRSFRVEATQLRGDVQCITVARPDGLFLVGRGYVVTHNSEQDAQSTLALENAFEWYTSGPRQRLQPGGAIVVVATRWGTMDLTARLLKAQANRKSDKWEVIEFPAIFDEGLPTERSLWPSFWTLEELQAVRASLSVQKWQAQWQQNPTSDEGAILKREWWRKWTKDYTPQLEYVIQSYDTAYSRNETADFSAITTWGVFKADIDSGANILLLNVKKGRWDFPELKRIAKEQYVYWQPDNVLIEAKATGTTLQQELRKVGIPVTMYSPGGRRAGQDKISRANSVATILESGMVWAPDTDWADDLIEECAAFPHGDNDDLCLAEGSLILMADGASCPVEQVRVGDRVATPSGAREVTASAYTGMRPAYEMTTAEGSVVLTGNHPVGTVAGWLTPDQLQNTLNSTIVMVSKPKRGYSWHGPQNQGLTGKRLALTGSSIVGILKAHVQHIAVILEGLVGYCTGMFGLFTMGLSLWGTRSTMWMRTRQTTTYQTYSACPENYTGQCGILDKKPMLGRKNNVSIWRQYVAKQPCGTPPLKGESGIDATHRTAYMPHMRENRESTGRTLNQLKGRVLSVVKRFIPKVQSQCVVPKSALTNAEGVLLAPRNLDKLGFANIAEGSFILSRPEGNTVVTYANSVVIKPAGMHSVYNLSVAGAKCYFANGFLVHNCDSMIMALMRFRAGNFISLKDDEEDRPSEKGAVPEYS